MRKSRSAFSSARRPRRRVRTASTRGRALITNGSRVIGIRMADAGAGTMAIGHARRTQERTGSSRTGTTAGISKATGERRAVSSATTIAGIATTVAATTIATTTTDANRALEAG